VWHLEDRSVERRRLSADRALRVLTAADWAAVLDEGAALLRFAAPKAASHDQILR
jgi:hypothetical protein